MFCFFFFQAQDGIRDLTVTGVQTCALPIYPIASGAIEGACRHYVKDRMERTGMSWVKPGAQAMLQLRATALNGDWDAFIAFRIQHETQRLYPHRHLVDDVSWPLAV